MSGGGSPLRKIMKQKDVNPAGAKSKRYCLFHRTRGSHVLFFVLSCKGLPPPLRGPPPSEREAVYKHISVSPERMPAVASMPGPLSEGAVAVGDWGSVEGREQLIDRLLSAKV